MKTAYCMQQQAFSDRARAAAVRQVYPLWFGEAFELEDTCGEVEDLKYAIDCRVAVPVEGFRPPLRLSIQERFRRPRARQYGDITVTEWNLATNTPSELHKLGAHLFVCGFYDETDDSITAAKAFSVAHILVALISGEVQWRPGRRPGGDQSYLAIPVSDLRDVGAVLFSYDASNPRRTP